MNFSKTAQTGDLGELAVTMLFTEWGWNVGTDRIDVGYDLCVMPTFAEFNGQRFMVQVKSTSSFKAGGAAQVYRSRLREYALNRMPVFLVRRTSEGVLYWLHVQAWCVQNSGRLQGDGKSGVKMPKHQRLDDKKQFLACLREVLRLPEQSNTALADLASQRGDYLSSLDPRFKVSVNVVNGVEYYRLTPAEDRAHLPLEFAVKAPDSIHRDVQNAIKFGLPLDIEVEQFRIKNSKLQEALNLGSGGGRLSLTPMSVQPARITMRAGSDYKLGVPCYSQPGKIHMGKGGGAVIADIDNALLAIDARWDAQTGEPATYVSEFRQARVCLAPLQQVDELVSLGDFADAALRLGAWYLEVTTHDGRRGRLFPSDEGFENYRPTLLVLRMLGMMHKITRAVNSNFQLKPDTVIAWSEVEDIEMAYLLLKGDFVRVAAADREFSTDRPVPLDGDFQFTLTHPMCITVCGDELAVLNVALTYSGYRVEALDGEHRYRLSPTDNSVAYASLVDASPLAAGSGAARIVGMPDTTVRPHISNR